MGTGETTRRLIEAYPDAWVIGLDASPDMVFRARQTYDDVQLARMEDPLPDGPWDLVISVLSVNTSTTSRRQALCRRVRSSPARWSSATSSSRRRARQTCVDVVPDGEVTWRGRRSGRDSQPRRCASVGRTPEPLDPLPFRDSWPSRRREPRAPAATSAARTTRPARRGSTSARAATARACRTGSARPAAPTPGREVIEHSIVDPAAPAAPTPSSAMAGGVTVALDGFGAEQGFDVLAEGARLAAADGIRLRVFGPPEELGLDGVDGIEVVPTAEWIGNDEDPVPAVRAKKEASVVRAAADVAEGARRRDGQPRLDRGDDGGGDLRPAPPEGRAAPGPRRAAAGPRQAGALPRRRRQRRGARPAPGPVRLPRRRLQRGRARRRAAAGRPALGRRGGRQGARGGRRRARAARRGRGDRVRRQRRGPRPAGRRGRRRRHRRLHRQRRAEADGGDGEDGHRRRSATPPAPTRSPRSAGC